MGGIDGIIEELDNIYIFYTAKVIFYLKNSISIRRIYRESKSRIIVVTRWRNQFDVYLILPMGLLL
jgi:hypothetical protein